MSSFIACEFGKWEVRIFDSDVAPFHITCTPARHPLAA